MDSRTQVEMEEDDLHRWRITGGTEHLVIAHNTKLNINLSINQSINQLVNQSSDESISESINHSSNKSINKSTDQSIDRPINQLTNQSIDRPINHDRSIDRSIDQSINEPINQAVDILLGQGKIFSQMGNNPSTQKYMQLFQKAYQRRWVKGGHLPLLDMPLLHAVKFLCFHSTAHLIQYRQYQSSKWLY